MRTILIAVAALSLAACGGVSETYSIPVGDAWSKFSSAGYAAGSYALPGTLSAMDVGVSFQAFPDRTANWKFTHKGKELARVEAELEGDGSNSSTISYQYVEGEGAGEFPKLAGAVKTFSRKLLIEGMDAQLEGRPMDMALNDNANAQLVQLFVGDMFQAAAKAMEVTPEQRAKWDQQDREHEERVAKMQVERVKNMSARSTKPTTDLSGY